MSITSGLGNVFSKVAAVGLLGLLVWLSASVVILPLWQRLNFAASEIDQQRKLLGRLQNEVQRLSDLPRQSASDTMSQLLLPQGSDAAMIAGLQTQFGEAGSRFGVRLTSFLPAEQTTQGPIRMIGIRAVASGSIDKLQSFLHSIESAYPAMTITGLTLAPPAQDRSPAGELDMSISIVAGAAVDQERSP